MSARVTTHTPFTDKECLLEALNKLGVKYTIIDNLIITDRVDYYGAEIFCLENGEYGFIHDSTAICNDFVDVELDGTETVVSNRNGIVITVGGNMPENITPEMVKEYPFNLNHLKDWTSVGEFLSKVDSKYREIMVAKQQMMAEEERLIEEERKRQFVETKRQQIIENAKQKGYSVKETKNGKQVQLVLTRTSY